MTDHEICDIDDRPDFNVAFAQWLSQKAGEGWELAGLAQYVVMPTLAGAPPFPRWKIVLRKRQAVLTEG